MAHNWLSDMLLLTATFLGSRPVWVNGELSRPYMTVSESKLLSLTCAVPPFKGLGCVNTLDIRFTPQQRSRDARMLADVSTMAVTCKSLDPMALVSGRVDHKVPMNSFLSIVFPFTEANFGTYACIIDFDDCGLMSEKVSLNITVNETSFDHIQTIGDSPRYFKASAELAHKVKVTWVRGLVQDFELMTLKSLIIDNDFEGRTETLFKIPALTTPEGKDVMLQCTDLQTASRLCNCSQSFDSTNNTVVLYARLYPYSSNVMYISEVKFSHGLQTVSASIKHNKYVKGLTLGDSSNAGVSASSTTKNTKIITDHVQSLQMYHEVTMWKWIFGVCITLFTVFTAVILICAYRRWSSMNRQLLQKKNGQSAARQKGKALRCFMKWLFCKEQVPSTRSIEESDKLMVPTDIATKEGEHQDDSTLYGQAACNEKLVVTMPAEERERGARGPSKHIAHQQTDEYPPLMPSKGQVESKANHKTEEAIVHSREDEGQLDQEQPEDGKINPSIPPSNSRQLAQTSTPIKDHDVHSKTDTMSLTAC